MAIQFQINKVIYNRLGSRVKKQGSITQRHISKHYGMSKMLRYICQNPICPIGYVQTKNPIFKKKTICKYTAESREDAHNIYDKTREECEEKPAAMIAQVKTEIKVEKKRLKAMEESSLNMLKNWTALNNEKPLLSKSLHTIYTTVLSDFTLNMIN